MKRLFYFLSLILLFPLFLSSQVNPSNILDTVETKKGKVILYKNYAWIFLADVPLILDIEKDSTGIIEDGWVNDRVRYLKYMKPDSIKDTVLYLITEKMKFCMPIPMKHLIRGFMYTHKGLDLRLKTGDTVSAVFDGVVRYARYNRGGYGYLVIVRHYNGLESYYAHLSKVKVKINQIVNSGDLVGLGGSTGRSRGPHLHFELRYRDVPIDPRRMIDLDSCRLITQVFPIRKEVFYPYDWDMNAVYHKIKSGDTLGELAMKYHTSIREICAMNKIRSTTLLRIGRVLRVR